MGCKNSKAGFVKGRRSGEGPSTSTSDRQEHRTAHEGRPAGDTTTLSGATPPAQEVNSKDRGVSGATEGGETTHTPPGAPDAAGTSCAFPASKAEAAGFQASVDIPAMWDAVFKDENPLEGMELDPPDDCESVVMKNGVRYRGEWRNGKQHGRGVQTQPDGVRYTGQFECGRIEGFGKLERPDGSKYEGEFHEGKAHTTSRSGVYTFSDGSKYIGQWVMDKRHGVGKEVTVEGSVYEGQFKYGCKHGHGRMKSPNGDIYEGDFSKGDMNGQGRYWWPDGRMYEGDWSMSRMHGWGVFLFADGRKYEGEFQDSKMQNEGKLTWPDGSSYEGGFKGGLPHGRGTHKTAADGKARVVRCPFTLRFMRTGACTMCGSLLVGATAALWNQGIRVKWLEPEEEGEEGGTKGESELSKKKSVNQQSGCAHNNDEAVPKVKEVESAKEQDT